ncbi:hypothetical protein [Tianweitania sediminis]|uniref:Uncharacterized protein n=1 Tax=Tianweitania sediminis TaxID=1502156 RepID=A0A8J7RK74_9HYPH|nr:hypothetical protein [Tianweitania sediminis]MBP0437229.1 hypothetical protein [Tianweitania sediminis]
MSDDSTITLVGTFATREAADIAIEHLVQDYGVERTDVFVQASDAENSAGTQVSGGDASEDDAEGSKFEPALSGSITVSADISKDELDRARTAFKDAGAIKIDTK